MAQCSSSRRSRTFSAGIRRGPEPGGLDPAGRRPRHAGLADAEADRGAQGQLPARERHRRRGARPLLVHGHEARPDLGVPRHPGAAQPRRPLRRRRLARRGGRPAGEPARADRREPDRAAARAAADGGGALRLSRLRHGAPGRAAARRQPRPARPARRDHAAPLGGAGGRRGQGRGHRGQPGLGQLRPQPARRLRPGGRAGDGRGARPRPHAQPGEPRPRRPRPGRRRSPTPATRATSQMVEQAKEYIRAGDIFQVVPSQRWAQPFDLPPFALYRALRRTNPSPYMFYFNFGGFQVDRRQPGDPRPRQGRHRDDPPDRRHPAARRDAGRGPRARGRAPRRPEGARRAPDAARPRPQRRRPRGEDRHRRSERAVHHRALQPRHAHRLQRRRRARRRPGRALGAARRPPRRHRLRRAQGPRDADHRRARGREARRLRRRRRLLRARRATWTSASRSAPRW